MRSLFGLLVCGVALLACRESHDEAPKQAPAAAAVGCSSDSECKGERICRDGTCVDPPAPATRQSEASPGATGKQGTDNSRGSQTSFFCINNVRCQKGQLCCPGSKKLCIPAGGACEPDDDGHETNVGFECNRFTNEPCAPGQKCVYGKIGRGPLTATAKCE